MGKRTKAAKAGPTPAEAAEELPTVRAQLLDASEAYQVAYRAAVEELHRVNAIVAKEGGVVVRLRQRLTALQRLVDTGEPMTVLEAATVDNPLRSDDLVADELEAGADRQAASIPVSRNLSSLIGGLARVARRTEAQTLAAAQYRMLYEQAQIGGAKAIDYEAVRVDTSGPSATAASDVGAEARRRYAAASQHLGMVQSSMIERVVCHGASVRELARSLGRNEGAASKNKTQGELLQALENLAVHLGFSSRAGLKRAIRRDGERAAWLPPQVLEVTRPKRD